MAYINNEKIAEIKNALAVVLRALFDTKQDNRLLIVRQVGRIGGLLTKIKGDNNYGVRVVDRYVEGRSK